MVTYPLDRLKIKTTSECLTSYAGLSVVATLFQRLNLPETLNTSLAACKQRHRGYSPSDFILSLSLTSIAGGECLDDIRVLEADFGLKKLLHIQRFPAANTLGEFLRCFTHRTTAALVRINLSLAHRLLAQQGLAQRQEVILDFDSSLIESHKREAAKTYKGFRGYNPLFATVPGVECVLAGLFREGNASPASHALSFLRRCRQALPSSVKTRFIRSDSAWYNHEVMDDCQKNGDFFTITADQTQAVLRAIRTIRDWQSLPAEDPDSETSSEKESSEVEVGETVHVIGSDFNSPAYRLVVVRRPKKQGDLFEGAYSHWAIVTNLNDWPAAKVVRFHRGRADAENILKELKEGFGMRKLPCGQLLANAAYFQTLLLAYNLIQLLKHQTLPLGWQSLSIKTLRFRLFHLAGRIVQHAREWLLKVPEGYPFLSLFRQARWKALCMSP